MVDIGLSPPPPPPFSTVLDCLSTLPATLLFFGPTSSDSIAEIENGVDLFFGDSSSFLVGEGDDAPSRDKAMILRRKQETYHMPMYMNSMDGVSMFQHLI